MHGSLYPLCSPTNGIKQIDPYDMAHRKPVALIEVPFMTLHQSNMTYLIIPNHLDIIFAIAVKRHT